MDVKSLFRMPRLKYVIYTAVMILVWFPFLKRVSYAICYDKTQGTVDGWQVFESQGRRGRRLTYYPIVDYKVSGIVYTTYGSRYERDEFNTGAPVTVLYDPESPGDAYLYNFISFWGPPLMWIVPLSLFLTMMLGLDIFKARKKRKKQAIELRSMDDDQYSANDKDRLSW
ncbi:MAG TPA: DUF3592 domain-containing protein [Ferruginibacter sp.]|nr:DUF3592 domain-containing protein [Ferruginibacter sp.]